MTVKTHFIKPQLMHGSGGVVTLGVWLHQGGVANVLTQSGDQLQQVGGPSALQRLQRLHHLQAVSNASTNRGVHAAKHRPRTDPQTVSHVHL